MNATAGYLLISLFAALIFLSIALPFASTEPDGLEKAAQNLGFEELAKETNNFAPMKDYDGTGDGSRTGVLIAGTAGALAVLCLGFGAGHIMKIGRRATG